MATDLRISSDEEAWDLLAAWVEGAEIPPVAEFNGWPRLRISISGEGYRSSLTTRQMAAYLNFRLVMGRAYSAIAHGAYDARRLKSYEEDQLELNTEVRNGSSVADTDFSTLVSAFAQIISANPTTSLIAAIVLGLLFVSRPIVLQHLENRSKQIDSEERGRLVDLLAQITQEDRAKQKLLERAVGKISKAYPQFSAVLPAATAAHWRLTASAANADRMTVSGLDLSQEHLEALAERRSYREAVIEEVEDVFDVRGIVRVQSAYRVQLQSKTMHLSATYRAPEMTDSRVKKLVSCITTGRRVFAQVEIKTVEKAHVIGRLRSFKALDDSEDAVE